MIRIDSATLVRSGTKLFEGFSWEIPSGGNWVISGANGSGKTLLLEMLAGIHHLHKGEVVYDFVNAQSWDARHTQKRQTIKYIPAHAIQSLTGGNDSFYYQQRYYSEAENEVFRVEELLGADEHLLAHLKLPDSLSVKHLLKLEITRLSNGQLKKVLLIKSLMGSIPRLLLLDYPFEGLDAESRNDLSLFIDFIAGHFKIQVILTDHHHLLPKAITHRIVLDNFSILKIEDAAPEETPIPEKFKVAADNPSKPAIIHIEDLIIRYGQKIILENFNWTVRKGDRWALIGRNGAGKTTLFSMIFADHPMAYTQKINLFGRRRGTGESIWDIKKRIAYLGPEIITFLNQGSITATARLYISMQNPVITHAQLQYLIDYLDAGNFIDLPVKFLSAGQLQMMQIIRCFASTKELLLLDEPFQFLDPARQRRVRNYMREILSPEITLILITHYENDISAWAGQIIKL